MVNPAEGQQHCKCVTLQVLEEEAVELQAQLDVDSDTIAELQDDIRVRMRSYVFARAMLVQTVAAL